MKAGLNQYRITILAGIVLLVLLLAIMVTGLLGQLRDLSIAEDDNMQWGISQIDVEFANLNATISKRLSDNSLADSEIRLRLDIAISRLSILNSGRAATLFAGSDAIQKLVAPIEIFSERAIEISDKPGPITDVDLLRLRALTEEVRPNVRKIALLGVELNALRSEARRAEFSRQLTRTGGIAIVLLALMAVLMLLLDRMLRRAARRDAELLTSSQLLKSTVAASLDAIVTANDKGQIVEFNAAAEDVFGWKRDEIIGKTMEETFIPHRMRDAHHSGMARYLETGKPRVVDGGRVELAALRKSGEEFPIELNITSVKDDDGTKFIAYLRDISVRKINDQKLIDARDRAERTDKAKSQFLTVMSHEMRTPLNGILGVLDLLKTTKLTAKQSRYADIATASSEILLEHISEALDITRIEAGTFQLTPQDFDLPVLVHSIADVLEPLAREKQLGLGVQIDEIMRRSFHGDSSRIRQIMTNLIGNAIKFTDEGKIGIKVSGIHGPADSSLKFAVADTGAGIEAEHLEQIFEDFVALAHSEGRQSRGDGLGLSISRKIARQMGGDVSVVSEVGKGSTFTLTVPLQRQEHDPQESATNAINPVGLTEEAREILLVEDNNINRKVLRDMLYAMGHRVTEAVNGVDCLEQAEAKRFDLIFMDISMPEMDGIEATRNLRAGDGPNVATNVIGLTAHGQEEFREQAERAGMNSFHTKPIRLTVLRGIISGFGGALHSPLPTEALQELCAALGPDRVQDTGTSFFGELNAFIAEARSGGMPAGVSELAEAAHKIKGAAALLGLQNLEAKLAELELLARNDDVPDLAERIEEVERISQISQTDFATVVQSFRL